MYPCKANNECTPYQAIFSPGTYQIELYGAGSGYPETNYGSYGAYTSGILNLNKNSLFYFYIGQRGSLSNKTSYNGGGAGKPDNYRSSSGGGSTDMRIVSGNWDDFESLKSRIMVAAGGGGPNGHVGGGPSGNGGTFVGETGRALLNNACHQMSPYTLATGSTQTSGGIGSVIANNKFYDGNFGKGGWGMKTNLSSIWREASGGGGGYFGGGASGQGNCVLTTAGGGSSFISGLKGCNAILQSSTDFDNITMSNQPIHYSKIVFTDGVMIEGGNSSMPHPSMWPFYDGAVRISILSLTCQNFFTCQINFYMFRFFILAVFVDLGEPT